MRASARTWSSPRRSPAAAARTSATDATSSPATIRQAVDASLTRLQTDYLDLYQIHWPNRGTFHFRNSWTFDITQQDRDKAAAEIAEILETLGELVKEGKLRAVGLSNESAWGAMKYLRLSEKKALPRIASLQNEYNLLYRHFDLDLAEVAHHEDVGLMAYSPLAAGLLTGKYQKGARPEGSRATINHGSRRPPDTLSGAGREGLSPGRRKTRPRPRPDGARLLPVAPLHDLGHHRRDIDGPAEAHDMAAADETLSDEVFADIAKVHRQYPMPL
jgi:aryl-alcohol dehydrogenase-like predicted oxidoreductase